MSIYYTNLTYDDWVEAEREAIFGIGAYDRQMVHIANPDGDTDARAGALYAEARRGGNALRQRMWAEADAMALYGVGIHADEVYRTYYSYFDEALYGCPSSW